MKKVRMRKQKGFAENLIGLLSVLTAFLLTIVFLQLAIHQAASTYIEDALAASNLASAVIDIEAYGVKHHLVVKNPEDCFAIYQRALKENLALDAFWICQNSSMIRGKVSIYEYSIYEVRGSDIVQYSFAPSGVMRRREYPGGVGTVTSPDGTVIKSTSVYSKIGFPIQSLEQELYCYKEKCVDIVEN